MHNQHDWPPDQVRDFIQERLEKNSAATTPFSFDDAFSDADDSDTNYAFSSIVIRADLARAVSYSQEGKELGDAEESSGVDAAGDASEPGLSLLVFGFPVTTLASPLCRDVSGSSPDANHLYTKFDSVSLSESPVEKSSREEDHYDVQDEPEVTDDEHEQQYTRDDSISEAQHRAIYARDSHSDPAALDAIQESRPPSPPQSELPPDTSASEDESEPPPGQTMTMHEKSASTPSLRLTSPSATSSSSPSFSLGHKPTRSVGPSVFERVMSKTRPSFLPPKSKHEDRKHMADWEKMMKRSRAAGIP
jgi:TBC1 domain family member 14